LEGNTGDLGAQVFFAFVWPITAGPLKVSDLKTFRPFQFPCRAVSNGFEDLANLETTKPDANYKSPNYIVPDMNQHDDQKMIYMYPEPTRGAERSAPKSIRATRRSDIPAMGSSHLRR
jgi:hypothetical protein